MTITKSTLSRLLAAVGITAVLAVSAAAPASAARISRTQAQDAYARVQDLPRNELRQRPGGGYFAHGAPDDPPGSAFQSFGNDQSMGLVR